MATVTKPIALDESFNTTEDTPRNIADVLAEGLSHITGRTASEVEYDNTDSGLTADNVQDALDEIAESVPTLPSVDIQTAVDEFETYNGGLLSALKVKLSPNQDLHGYSEPWVGGAGKNKLDTTVDSIKALNTDGTWSGNAYTWRGITYTILTDDGNNVIGIDTDGTASERGWLYLSATFYGTSGTAFDTGSVVSGYYFTSDNPSAIQNVKFIYYNNGSEKTYILIDAGQTVNHEKWYPMIRLATESDPTFEPYTNICPISGHTQVDVDVSDGDTTQEQVTVNLGGTYYSGTLDVVTGVFTPDTAKQTYPWGTYTRTDDLGNTRRRILATLSDALGTVSSDIGANISDSVEEQTGWTTDSPHFYIDSSNKTLVVFLPISTSDSTNIEVCYKLATPTPIQLSPTMVKALVGENHLSAPLDGQEITESKYKQAFTFDDVIAYIQSLS